ncbi:MAG: VWA domain-containing protein [Armatimonadetes bacterium]|nr:VWA domain-containing protein [Armatimonadota bacterium]
MRKTASQTLTGMFAWDKADRQDKQALLKDGLRTVSRVLYAAGGLHDKHLSVAYSTGASENSVGGRVVFLDSDILLQDKPGFDEDASNDVLVGSALVGANVKLTADAEVYSDVNATEKDENVKRVYNTTEFRAAEKRIEDEAPGLADYLDNRADYYLDPELVQALNDAAASEETSSEVACALLNNAMLHRGSAAQVEMGPYTEAVNEAIGRLERPDNSTARHETAQEVVAWFKELFDPEEPPPPPQGGGGDDDQDENDDQQESQGGGGSGQSGEGDNEGEPDENEGEPNDGDNPDGDGDKESDADNGDGKPKPAGPDMSEANSKFDKEMTVVQGTVENETGDSKAVVAIAGKPDDGDGDGDGKPGGAVDIGDDQPSDGWGDEVEPIAVRVEPHQRGNHASYEALKNELAVPIRSLFNKVSWTAQLPTMTEHGYRSGDLDEGGLSNLFIGDPRPAVFQRTEVFSRPDVVVGVMVDESGSMGGPKVEAAKRVATILIEAFRKVAGTRIRLWGHSTAWEGGRYYEGAELCVIYPYHTVADSDLSGVPGMKGRANNMDGAALWYAAQQLMLHDSDAQRRILFCVSDGAPGGGPVDGVEYNFRKAEAARKLGVEVYGVGIQNAYNEQTGTRLFGKEAFCILPDVESAGTVIGAFLTRTVNRLR